MVDHLKGHTHINRSVTNAVITAASIPIIVVPILNYKWMKISDILQISRTTLYKRLEKAGVSTDDHTVLTDQQLDDIICLIKQDHPNGTASEHNRGTTIMASNHKLLYTYVSSSMIKTYTFRQTKSQYSCLKKKLTSFCSTVVNTLQIDISW